MKDEERHIDPVMAAIARDGRIMRNIIGFVVGVLLIWMIAGAANAFQVCWTPPTENMDGTPLTDLAGYVVYFGTSSRTYSMSRTIGVTSGRHCYNVRTASGDYYVAMTAFDADGNESPYSNEVLKREGRLSGPSGGTLITEEN